MASTKEIRTRMKSVEQTLKITNAMYLIASSNLRKAKAQLEQAAPYFTKMHTTIADILHRSPELSHDFLDRRPEIPPEQRKVGYVVLSGDKGLAGAYNHNVLKLAERRLRETARPSCSWWAWWAGPTSRSGTSPLRRTSPMWSRTPL